MPYIAGQIRNNQGNEQHSWVMTSAVHRSLNDFFQKWGKRGRGTGRKETMKYVKHLGLKKSTCEVTGVFFHTKK